MCQQNCLGIRGKWVSKIQEYELEIRPTKLIKGQGLAKLLTQGNEEALGIVCQNELSAPVFPPKLQCLDHHWYSDIIFFLQNLTCPQHLKGHKRRSLRLKVVSYCITQEALRWRNPDGIILRCVKEQESKKLLTEFHLGFCVGNYVADTIALKIVRAGYY